MRTHIVMEGKEETLTMVYVTHPMPYEVLNIARARNGHKHGYVAMNVYDTNGRTLAEAISERRTHVVSGYVSAVNRTGAWYDDSTFTVTDMDGLAHGDAQYVWTVRAGDVLTMAYYDLNDHTHA